MDRTQLLRRLPSLAAIGLALLLSPAAWAGCPGCKNKSADSAQPGPPPTVLPPPGYPPPAVYGFPTTAYRSSWYNTHYWPRKTYHHGFYGDYWQWGYFPGY